MAMRTMAVAALTGALLAACGGRASLDAENDQAWRRVLQAQETARPSKDLPPLTADEAKIIVDNHYATFHSKDGGKAPATTAAGPALSTLSGLLTPANVNIPTDTTVENPNPIRLQAK
jgi:hypothetical protein